MSGDSVRILLVEDNEPDREYIRILLRHAEESLFEVDCAEWLSTAITVIENRHYDAVLLDLSLPDSFGIDTLVQVRESNSRVPIIIMTGANDMHLAIQCVNYDAQDYLIKGEVKARHLEVAIHRAIQSRKVRRSSSMLLHRSIAQFQSPDDPAILGMVRSHLDTINDFYRDVTLYVRKNAVGHVESYQAICRKHEIDRVIQDLRSIISDSMEEGAPSRRDTAPPRSLPERASDTLNSFRPPEEEPQRPSDPASAEEAVSQAIEDLMGGGSV